jgi:hypothetical protein
MTDDERHAIIWLAGLTATGLWCWVLYTAIVQHFL